MPTYKHVASFALTLCRQIHCNIIYLSVFFFRCLSFSEQRHLHPVTGWTSEGHYRTSYGELNHSFLSSRHIFLSETMFTCI